jgi:hypothetical protein
VRGRSLAGLAVAALALAGCTPKLPSPWAGLGLPTQGLKKVQDGTDQHGLYAEYAGTAAGPLLDTATAALRHAGYTDACTAFDGNVRGFSLNGSRLVAKVDMFGDTALLSVFDEDGHEPLLHGVCFGKYHINKLERRSTR